VGPLLLKKDQLLSQRGSTEGVSYRYERVVLRRDYTRQHVATASFIKKRLGAGVCRSVGCSTTARHLPTALDGRTDDSLDSRATGKRKLEKKLLAEMTCSRPCAANRLQLTSTQFDALLCDLSYR